MKSKDLFSNEMVDIDESEPAASPKATKSNSSTVVKKRRGRPPKASKQLNDSSDIKSTESPKDNKVTDDNTEINELLGQMALLKQEIANQKVQLEEMKQAQAPRRIKKVILNATVNEDIKKFCTDYAKLNGLMFSHAVNELLELAIKTLKE